MKKSIPIEALALVAIGTLLGYLAATTDAARIVAAVAPTTASVSNSDDAAACDTESCCQSPRDRGYLLAMAASVQVGATVTAQADKKPDILVSFGDDIGQTNVSAYSMGLMGYSPSLISFSAPRRRR